jgi:host factor-I protein
LHHCPVVLGLSKVDAYVNLPCGSATWIGSAAREDAARLSSRASNKTDIGVIKMAGERPQNLQDAFLNHVRKHKIPLTVFLVNGVKLQGIVSWVDNFCVLLRRDAHSQLVYKHAISTIMPSAPVQLYDPAEEGADKG